MSGAGHNTLFVLISVLLPIGVSLFSLSVLSYYSAVRLIRTDKEEEDSSYNVEPRRPRMTAILFGEPDAASAAFPPSPASNNDFRHMDGEGEVQEFKRSTSKSQEGKERYKRVFVLHSYTVMYHATSTESAAAIERDPKRRLLRGKTGIAGGGIYFAQSKAEAIHKTRVVKPGEKGAVYRCKVWLGKTKSISVKDDSLRFRKLRKEGYDSVMSTMCPNPEWAVYNADQVEVLDREDVMKTH